AFFQRPGSSEPVADEDVVKFLGQFDLTSFPGSLTAEDPNAGDPNELGADDEKGATDEPADDDTDEDSDR
ncbi:MAG: hypothetical protein AAGG01_04615, partial [Planctomycetota bacterium]